MIGLIIPDFSNTYYTAIAQSVLRVLRSHNYECFICSHEEDPEIDLHYLQIFRQTRVDGILYVHPAHGSNSEYVRRLTLAKLPIVEINRQREADLLDAVLANNIQGAYQMTSYLIARGHRRIALILGETTITTGRDRLEGYRRALADADIPIVASYVRPGSFSRTHGETATRDLLNLSDPPTAIFSANNRILLGVLSVLGRRGYSIPNDISVVAFDDSEWLSTWHPSITAVDIVIDDLAQLAVDLLLAEDRRRNGAAQANDLSIEHLRRRTRIVPRCRRTRPGEHRQTEAPGQVRAWRPQAPRSVARILKARCREVERRWSRETIERGASLLCQLAKDSCSHVCVCARSVFAFKEE